MEDNADSVLIAHLGDLHLGRRWLSAQAPGGVNLRESDVYRALDAVLERLLEQDRPEVVVIAGDVFDSVTPSTRSRSAAFRFCRELHDEGVEVLICGGNHDHAATSAPSPLQHLKEFFDCHLALVQDHVDLAGVRFHLLPYQTLAGLSAGRDLQAFEFAPGPNVLVSHAYISHPDLGAAPEKVQLPLSIADDPAFCAVMLGHIHQHRRLGETIYYSGAIERLNIGEIAATPGYWLHRIDRSGAVSSESVEIGDLGEEDLPRQMTLIEIGQAGAGLDELQRRVQMALRAEPREGAIIQIRIAEADVDLRQSAHPALWRGLADELGAIHCDVQIRTEPLEQTLGVEITSLPSRLEEGFRDYLVEKERPELVDLALETMAEVSR
ncbi:metallophosphoesterase family protein [Miltoncostaea oceani]|uniref:metallophosphoesterase family protein n=1 Tax=Miltoncostaea oceani TaxID=2843216 RepID=UPI001C3C6528|nr:metallophosphoesterase [Miltoncostaea oceani]